MKNSKFIAAIFSILFFAVASTAFGAELHKPVLYIGQSIDEISCCVAAARSHTGDAVISVFTGFIHWIEALFPAPAGVMMAGITYIATAKDVNAMLDKARTVFPEIPWTDINTSNVQVDQIISDTKGTYVFDYRAQRGPQPNASVLTTDILIDQNDIFLPYAVGYFPCAVDQTIPGSVREQTYINNQVFATEAGATIYQLACLYNGTLALNVGKQTSAGLISTAEFEYRPELEQTSATTSSQRNADAGWKWLPEMPYFFGGTKNNITLNFQVPASPDIAADTSNWDTRVRIRMRGFTIFNGMDWVSKSDILKAAFAAAGK